MPQNKITTFFKQIPSVSSPKQLSTTSPKRSGSSQDRENDQNLGNMTPQSKRSRLDGGDEAKSPFSGGDGTGSPMMMSPEQKKMIASKKAHAKLIKTSKELQIITRNMGVSWFQALENEFGKPYFKQLNDFVLSERSKATIFPIPEDVWSWTTRTSIQDVRVVILGQDPYHGPRQAHGLCFSVQPGIPPPPSLINMYKELESDIPYFTRPNGGYLAGWADQGVLLLNAVLTVRSGNANSHKDKGWEKITDAVIRWISDNSSGVVFLLWGSYAHKKAQMVDKKKHHLLKSVHPSPLSAHRGFLGCKHFSKCNEILKSMNREPINWANLPQSK